MKKVHFMTAKSKKSAKIVRSIKCTSHMIRKHYGLNLPEGSWCVRMKIENDDLWSQVKEGKIRGLSIEGFFIDKVEEMSVKVKTPNMKKTLKKIWFSIKISI